MDKKNREIILISGLVLLIIITVSGVTYSFFNATVTGGSENLRGQSYVFDVDVNLDPIRSGGLIPTDDDLITASVNSNSKCLDKRGYALCSMYELTLTNNGAAQTLNGYLQTDDSTTYTTNHLKYRLYQLSGSTYSLVSDTLSIAYTGNAKNYFKLNNSNINFSLSDGSTRSQSTSYYLVIWLSDIDDNQLEDENQQFVWNIVFDSVSGNTVSSQFLTI